MTIKARKELKARGIEIDTTGPEGNAFVIIGYAKQYAKQMCYSKEETDGMLTDMQSGSYDNLIDVFDKHFGEFVTIYR